MTRWPKKGRHCIEAWLRLLFLPVLAVSLLLLAIPLSSVSICCASPAMEEGQESARPRLFPRPASTADHAKFKALSGPFEKATDVTKACLECHNKAGEQVISSQHWTWRKEGQEGKPLGKAVVLNNF